jgi:hypothetical protein
MKRRQPRHVEDDIQRAIAQRLDALKLLWCHVPNGGKRNMLEAKRMKSHGVKPGVPDVLIFDSPPNRLGAKGAALELKAPGGKTSPEQRGWLHELDQAGYATAVAVGLDEAHAQLDAWGYGCVGRRAA